MLVSTFLSEAGVENLGPPFFERYPTGIDFDGSAVGQVVISESFQKPHLGGLRLAGTTTWPIYFPPSGRVKIPPLFLKVISTPSNDPRFVPLDEVSWSHKSHIWPVSRVFNLGRGKTLTEFVAPLDLSTDDPMVSDYF
jgi:hypothetical protein